MVFSSATFLFAFLPITLVVYHVANKRIRDYWLLFASMVFFAWSQPGYLWIIIVSVLVNYVTAMLIYKFKQRKLLLALGVVLNLALLFYFKYFNFFFDTVDHLFHTDFQIQEIILPVGISFFTFQGMSYVIDVYRGDVQVQKNPLKVALYIMLFPQLVAGPIVRLTDIEDEINSPRSVSLSDFEEGITRFIVGFAKKAVIANSMAEIVDSIWKAGLDNNTVIIAWAGSIAYSLQIYYDFSGYSDMAIGIGRMLGFHFCENFNLPYISSSITEFWRRWHISLSSWFRDYVYIPLGGNRRHNYRNLIIVFLLTGLWHGASWTFVLWGVWNVIFIVLEKMITSRRKKMNKPPISMPVKVLLHAYALVIINIGWVLFRADTVSNAIRYIGTMFGIGLGEKPGFTVMWYLNNWNILVMILAIVFSTPVFAWIKKKFKELLPENCLGIIKICVMYSIFIIGVMRVFSGNYNPFIYFQF